MEYKLPNFKILTKKSILDIPYENDKQYQENRRVLTAEQDKIIAKNGYDFNKYYDVHFYESAYTNEFKTDMSINDAIQCLAIKDGCDLVKFDNGNIGYVAYYNGHKNGFEILSK